MDLLKSTGLVKLLCSKKSYRLSPNKTLVPNEAVGLKIKPFIYAGQMCTYYYK